MNLQYLIASVRQRTTHRGISTAAPFLRELTACLSGVCPSKILADVSADAWARLVKEAESRLVYHADDMTIGSCGAEVPPAFQEAGETPTPQRAGGTPTPQSSAVSLPPFTIATFPAVITTTRQDRDGDVLETKGADLDPAAPLLWQHLPSEPIGRLLSETKRTKTSLMGRFAVAATALGHDAALLAEHGALRISHGFLPDEFEPLDEKDAFSGFHVTRFKILEVSLVSVPSNPDAVITQFSREKLSHPLVKAWAGALFDARPVMAAVPRTSKSKDPQTRWCIKMLKKSLGHCAAIAANPDATTLIADEATKAQGHIEDVIETMAGKSTTSNVDVARVRLESLTYTSGRVFSAENEKKLQAAAANYKAIASDDEAHPEIAALAHKGYQCVKGLFDTGGDSGNGQDDMDAYTVVGDSADERGQGSGKSGRAVSAAHAAVIHEAIGHGQAIKSHDAATPGHKSMAKTAIKKLRQVLDGNAPPPPDPDNEMNYGGGSGAPAGMAPAPGGESSYAASCKAMLARATSRFAANDDLAELKSLGKALGKTRRKVKQTVSRIQRQRKHDAESAALAAFG